MKKHPIKIKSQYMTKKVTEKSRIAMKNKNLFKVLFKNIQIEMILRYNFTPTRLAKIKESHNNNFRFKSEEMGIHVLTRL